MPINTATARRFVGVVVVAVVTSSALAGPITLEPEPAQPPELASLTDRLDRDQPLFMAAYEVPGVALAVVRDGELQWSGGYGVASVEDGADVDADTVFQVASISKSLTAWGVMHLVETGQVSLDEPIETYLTRWAFPPSAYDSSGVTVARVLNHTAGLNRVDGYPLPVDQPLPSIEESLDGNNGGGQSLRVDMEPGQQFNYANAGYTLLQLMIEEVTGQRFSDYMQEAILDPLGMTNSTFDPDRVSHQATGHYPGGESLPHYRLTEQAAGGLYSTANDLALLVAATMPGPDGEPVGRGVLTSESVHTMLAPQEAPDGSMVSFGHLHGHLDHGFTTTGNNGHNTGWITNMVIIPELGEGIVILTNSDTETTGLTLRSWTQWLGLSDTFTTDVSHAALDELSTIMIVLAALISLGGTVMLVVTTVQASRGRRRWLWHVGSTVSRGLVMRGLVTALAIGGLVVFLAWPERQEYLALLPTEANTVLVAAVLAVAAVVVRAGTRRAGS
ncbi:CubicO group peptidase (beta-lactamase class C family) [Mycetocola sp. CAN_C7]|uniref:serine hydrolase domain-containing protein n=1 Tax=Mycetocola sp. CAN_C7 TaxID=2787724 RepID=UPI0018CA4DA7